METSHPKKKLSHAWDFFVIPCYTLTGKSVCLLGHTDQLQQKIRNWKSLTLRREEIEIILVNFLCHKSHFNLTGESVPVTKTPLPNPKISKSRGEDILFNLKEHSKHVLFCGTHILQTRLSFYGLVRHKLPPLIFRVEISNLFKQYLCRWKNELIHWVSWVIHACTVYTFPLDDW